MSHTSFLLLALTLNSFNLNKALADDPYTTISKQISSGVPLTPEMKRKPFDDIRIKKVNEMSAQIKKDSPGSGSLGHIMTKAEQEKAFETEAAEDKNNSGEIASSTPAPIKKQKETVPSPNAASTPITVKSEKPLDEIVFPGTDKD